MDSKLGASAVTSVVLFFSFMKIFWPQSFKQVLDGAKEVVAVYKEVEQPTQ